MRTSSCTPNESECNSGHSILYQFNLQRRGGMRRRVLCVALIVRYVNFNRISSCAQITGASRLMARVMDKTIAVISLNFYAIAELTSASSVITARAFGYIYATFQLMSCLLHFLTKLFLPCYEEGYQPAA